MSNFNIFNMKYDGVVYKLHSLFLLLFKEILHNIFI
jgi:hypothetical protein